MFDRLKSILGKKNEIPEMSLDTYSSFPLYRMLQDEAPFDDWESKETAVPDTFRPAFKVFASMYQMYIFYMLTAQRFGYEIANRTLTLQVERLNRGDPELGRQLETAIQQIHRSVLEHMKNPPSVEIKGKKTDIPLEYQLAVEFLTVGEDALFPPDNDSGELPNMKDTDWILAACLEQAKSSAAFYFQPVISVAKVVL